MLCASKPHAASTMSPVVGREGQNKGEEKGVATRKRRERAFDVERPVGFPLATFFFFFLFKL